MDTFLLHPKSGSQSGPQPIGEEERGGDIHSLQPVRWEMVGRKTSGTRCFFGIEDRLRESRVSPERGKFHAIAEPLKNISTILLSYMDRKVIGLWMRSSPVVKASDSQFLSRNPPGFDPSILRHSGISGAADKAVLNKSSF